MKVTPKQKKFLKELLQDATDVWIYHMTQLSVDELDVDEKVLDAWVETLVKLVEEKK